MNVAVFFVGTLHGNGERLGDIACDLDARLAREDLDLADRLLRDVAAATQERHEPLRIGVLRAPDVDREPRGARVVEGALLRAARLRRADRAFVAVRLARVAAGR